MVRATVALVGLLHRRRWLGIVGAGLLGAAACLSPTLPLPPPDEPDVERIGQGQYLLRGQVPLPGRVEALNLRTGRIFGQLTDTEYAFVVDAAPGDPMTLWYTSGGEISDSARFEIPESLDVPRDGGSAPDGAAAPDGG